MTTRPLAYLTIIPPGRMTSYRLCDAASRLLLATRAYVTDEARTAHGLGCGHGWARVAIGWR